MHQAANAAKDCGKNIKIGTNELLDLHKRQKLSEFLDIKTEGLRKIRITQDLPDHILRDVHLSMMGSGALNDEYLLDVPDDMREMRNRLFYALLSKVDEDAAVFSGRALYSESVESAYNTGRTLSHLHLYLERNLPMRTLVSLVPGTREETLFTDLREVPVSIERPDIIIADLPDKPHIRILDAGMGGSPIINRIVARIRESGRTAEAYGINLVPGHLPRSKMVPEFKKCFSGIFEYLDFPTKFDIVFSQIGSAFYTPDPHKYVEKLSEILSEGGVAIMNISRHAEWIAPLMESGLKAEFLASIKYSETLDAHLPEGQFRDVYGHSRICGLLACKPPT